MSPRAGMPAFQFYPGDWQKDPGVRSLDYEARGIWFEMILLMHESDDRGKLMLNGKAMPEKALSQILGLSEAKTKQATSKLEAYGVASRDPETGVLMNRRMVRDEATRRARAEAGRKGGLRSRPPKAAQSMRSRRKANEKQNRTSSSSSSPSPSSKDKEFANETEQVFNLCCTLREERLGKVPGPPLQLTKARRSKISARLAEGFTQAELEDAACGFYADPWEDRDKHLDPKYAFKNDETVRKWIAAHRTGTGTRPANVQEAEWLRE